jgi:hypothetical protein
MWQVMNKGRSFLRAQNGSNQSRWRTRVGWVPIWRLTAALVGSVAIGCSGGVSGEAEDEPSGGNNDDEDDGDETEGVVTADGGGVVGGSGDGGAVDPGEVAAGDGCFSNRDFLATQAWKGVVEAKCLACHGPGGIAEAQAAKFTIKPAAYPGFLEANLAEIEELSKTSFDGVSVLLSKATGNLEHGGGQVIAEGSEEFALLEELVERGIAGDTCQDPVAVPTFDDVELLSPALTWRKITLNLAGRLPTSAESDKVAADGEAALPGLLSNLMKEDAFYDRLVEMFNDQWLTDAYLRNSNGVLNNEQFPNLTTYYEEMDDANKEAARRSIAREPLQLIAYIVKNERPFTEIVTADYTVLNSYTAPIYNNDDVGFTGTEYNEKTWVAGKIFVSTEESGMVALPHAGILTSPIFLNRYPTSRTNLNRHRASTVLRELLATDILKVADRPIDPTKAVNLANPTREEASCKMCHVTIDPIAGAFQKFDDNDYERYRPDREWPTEMFLPGFADQQMQVSDYSNALQWLGKHIAADERFPLAVVRNMYERLMGQKPEDFPEDPSGAAYVGWADQDQTIRAISKEFVDAKYNLKTVISALALSPYFRAVQANSDSETRLAQLWDLGTGRLLSPEALSRKLVATTGYTWMDGDRNMLTNSLNILYGGIDSQSVTERLQTPNGIMSAVMWRMANEVSCAVVPTDFAKAADKRLLFKDVTIETIPEDALGEIDEAGKAAIEKNIAALYTRLFGEAPAVDSTEFARAYDLFVSTWKVGRNDLAFEGGDRYLPWECRYRRAPGAAEDLPEDQRFELDENYTVRSWMAVMTYLLSDYRFLYD